MRAILTYHSVDSSGSAISLSEAQFRAHVRFLVSGHVRVLPLADLPASPLEGDAVALTFDDGFRNFSTQVVPLLAAEGLPATVFVVSDAVGGSNAWGGRRVPGIPDLPLMDWDEVEQAAGAGFEIGAHTRRHPDLTRVRGEQLLDEVVGCADIIDFRLGRRPQHFAYPYGAVTPAVVDMARQAFRHCCTTELRSLGEREDPALLPRIDAYYLRESGHLEAWGSPSFRRRLWVRRQGRRIRALLAAGATQ